MLEQAGLPTVVIGLVRPHMEKTGNPRGLFVPFPLGRPLAEAGDAGFQRRVLMAALALLERNDGPVVLEDFPDDAPSMRDLPRWRPPFTLPAPARPLTPEGWATALATEMALVRPWHDRAQARFGRTSIGPSGQAPDKWPDYAAGFLAGALPEPPPALPSAALALRFLADDLKAFYTEAVQAEGPAPSVAQINAWLWRETVAGQMLITLREMAAASDNAGLKTMGTRFLVPANWLPSAV
jgi:hypothetical protein